jgi:hypothetical protein
MQAPNWQTQHRPSNTTTVGLSIAYQQMPPSYLQMQPPPNAIGATLASLY